MMVAGIWELELHGKTEYQARIAINAALRRAAGGTYRIRCIHGYHSGTALRDMIRREYAARPQVLRVETGVGAGVTDLVLREF